MPRKSPDLDFDFNIFVDPSCLSAPMDEEAALPQTIQDNNHVVAGQTERENAEVPPAVTTADSEECNKIRWKDIHLGPSRVESRPQSAMGSSAVEDAICDLLEEIHDAGHNGPHNDDADDLDTPAADNPTDQSCVEDEVVDERAVHEADDGDSHVHENGHGDVHEDATNHDQSRADVTHGEEDGDSGGPEDMGYMNDSHDQPTLSEDGDDDNETRSDELRDEGFSNSGEGHDDGHSGDSSIHGVTHTEENSVHEEPSIFEEEHSLVDDPHNNERTEDNERLQQEDSLLEGEEEADSPRTSLLSDRRGSLRTEALIQAAARAVVAKIEERAIAAVHSHRNSVSLGQVDEHDLSLLSTASDNESNIHERAKTPDVQLPSSRRQSSNSSGSQVHHQPAAHSISGDEAGDSSSHHEAEDDVFSDRSARSSLGSFDGVLAEDEPVKTPIRRSTHSRSNSPRLLSGVSSLSQYEQQEFVTATSRSRDRDTPRMPFRTPSDVRAIQMSSPTPSVFNGASPRSTRRNGLSGGSSSGLPTVSRLGSPAASAQYSPKGRSTPPRFKARKEAAPLVLLHVTLLPLRWAWAEALDGLDGACAPAAAPGKAVFEPSDELKALRDAWRQLRDRVGDTVLERGILLPHPQNDYEVLEERLLEALELPLRRRARILECGHYLGPANEMADDEESESEDECSVQTGRFQRRERRHWCGTCKGEIKYEDLGPGKVFRVKVYASNGLMKAGAWEACWKEMERVDVELEPIVDTTLHRELERLSAFQIEQEERRQQELDDEERARREEEELRHEEEEIHLPAAPQEVGSPYHDHHAHPDMLSSPPLAMHASPPSPIPTSSPILLARSPTPLLQEPIDTSEARRRRDEARLREIYGLSPPAAPQFDEPHQPDHSIPSSLHAEARSSPLPPPDPHSEPDNPTASMPSSSSYAPPPRPSPRSPSEEAHERRAARRREGRGGPYQTASLPELLLEAARVLLRDRRNAAIAVLALVVVLLALRPRGEVDVVGAYRVGVAGVPGVPVLREGVVVGGAGRGLDGGYRVGRVETVAGALTGKVLEVAVNSEVAQSGGVAVGGDSEAVDARYVVATTAAAPVHQEPEGVVVGPQPEAGSSFALDATTEKNVSGSSGLREDASSVPVAPAETVTEKKVVRVVETVTETVKVSVTATESVVAPLETEMETETADAMEADFGGTTERAVEAEPTRDTLAGPKLGVCPVEKTDDICVAGRDFVRVVEEAVMRREDRAVHDQVESI